MNTALATIQQDEWAVITQQASMLIKSRFLPSAIDTPEKAVAIILTGWELGIGAMAALQTINVIQGKPTVSPQLMLALINRSGQLEDMKMEASAEGAVCTMKRKGRSSHTVHFGADEARAMNLLSKDNYKKQPATMYQWRAVAACARVVFPDVVLGLYTPDEMGADVVVNTDGEMSVIESLPANEPRALPETTESNVVPMTSRQVVDDGVERSDVLSRIRKECAGLGYDDRKTELAISKAMNMSTPKMEDALESLKKLRVKKETEAKRNAINDAFAEHGWDEGDIERYLKDFGGVPLEEMDLDQLVTIYDDMAVQA